MLQREPLWEAGLPKKRSRFQGALFQELYEPIGRDGSCALSPIGCVIPLGLIFGSGLVVIVIVVIVVVVVVIIIGVFARSRRETTA